MPSTKTLINEEKSRSTSHLDRRRSSISQKQSNREVLSEFAVFKAEIIFLKVSEVVESSSREEYLVTMEVRYAIILVRARMLSKIVLIQSRIEIMGSLENHGALEH